MSRSKAAVLARSSQVLVNDKVAKANHILYPEDVVRYEPPAPAPILLTPEDIPLKILYEDDDVLVLDKPRKMVVHPAVGNWSGTLVNALLWHWQKDGISITDESSALMRPGIVHRLDKDTSGVLMVAKNDYALKNLHNQLHERTVLREYLAITIGTPKQEKGSVDSPIARHKTDRKKMAVVEGGRRAVTHYEVVEALRGYSLLRLRLETGRTHQIRVHMSSIGFPILGDSPYGGQPKGVIRADGQLLHARMLGFTHPRTGMELRFETPPPQYFTDILNLLH